MSAIIYSRTYRIGLNDSYSQYAAEVEIYNSGQVHINSKRPLTPEESIELANLILAEVELPEEEE